MIGEDEVASGQVLIKRLGLLDGHPEKEGVKVELASMVPEVKRRLVEINSEGAATKGINGLSL
jgi:histidyl-tRNA synthetase